MPVKKHRILIVDDHSVLRAGLQAIIEATEDLTVCGEAINAEQARATIEAIARDVLANPVIENYRIELVD